MIITNLFFDFDGVLVDSIPFHRKAFNEAFSNYNINHSDFQYVSGRSSESLVRDYLNRLDVFDEQRIKQIVQEKQKIVRNEIGGNFPIFNNEIQVLTKLSVDYQLSIISSSTNYLICKFIAKYNLENIFTQVISFEMTRQGKPSPEPYLLALEKNDVNPERVIVIEDSISGIESAIKAGLSYITFNPTGEPLPEKNDLEKRNCKSYDEIYDYIVREIPKL